jgi:probable addiction module antidote protein
MKNSIAFEKVLHSQLEDPAQAAEYLNACFEEGPEVFLQGLRDVVEANGGVSKTASTTSLNRESLYRLLSKRGNPRLASLTAVLSSLGLKLSFSPA